MLDAILEAIPVTPGEARGYLARFLFRGDDVFKEVRTLSGGERSRLELALLGILPSNLMLLDEPTNHLDIAAREAIEAFLAESPATLLVVSHDRRLLETICERLWVVDDGLAVPFDGGYRAWRAAVADGWTVAGRGAAAREPHPVGAGRARRRPAPSTNGRGRDGGRRGAGAGRGGRRRAREGAAAEGAPEALEGRLPPPQRGARRASSARLGLRKSQLELSIGMPSVTANFVEMRRVTSELADVERALADAEDAWLELEELAP